MAGFINQVVAPGSRELKIGVLTVSDRCSAGEQEDKSGPNLKFLLQTHLHKLGAVRVITEIVPDELAKITNLLLTWVDMEKCIMVLTTGGTGFSSRDVTPEATKAIIEREAPGLVSCMLTKSVETTPMAMLSRPVCGIRKSCLIVNLPGSKKGSQECFEFILPALSHAFDLLTNNADDVSRTHKELLTDASSVKSDNSSSTQSLHNIHSSTHQLMNVSNRNNHHRHHHHHHHSHHRKENCKHKTDMDAADVICLVQDCNSKGSSVCGSKRESLESLQSYGSSSGSSEVPYDFSYSSSESATRQCNDPHPGAKVYIDTPKVAARDRFSPYPMILVSKALSIVLSSVQPSKKRHLVNIHTGLLGKVLMEDVKAKDPYPPFAASIKDGYAVIAADGAGIRKVVEPITAGHMPQQPIKRGFCSRINTGAPIPLGSDAVVAVEDTSLEESGDDGTVEIAVNIKVAPQVMQDIRPVGFDIKQGELILSAGEKLGPSELGLLAMAGISMVAVYPPPTIGIFSTGDELVSPGLEKGQGQIYDSNKISLLTAIREQGHSAADLGVLADDYKIMKEKLLNVIDEGNYRIIISTGGVSMGEKDLVKKFLAHFGEIKFGRLNMKPGKPTMFATISRGSKTTFFFALPGNPVSALVTFYLFALPAIRKLAGFKKPHLQRIQARLDFEVSLDSRPEYHRARLNWDSDDGVPLAVSTGNQCSSRLLSMRSCHALVELPSCENTKHLERGSLVTALLIPKLVT